MSELITYWTHELDIKEIRLEDKEYGSDEFYKVNSIFKTSIESRTVFYPLVKINNYIFNEEEITYFYLSCTEFLPLLDLSLIVNKDNLFLIRDLPKDGDLVSIYIRGQDDVFRPIRNDFIIKNIDILEYDTKFYKIYINSVLYIPHLYEENNFAIKGTSIEVLKEISKKLKLGFISNETETNDEMVWINPNLNYIKFIENITNHSWKDENSFFISFIDIYYNLNFINVNSLLENNKKIFEGIGKDVLSSNIDSTNEKEMFLSKKIFSNYIGIDNTNFFIEKYNIVNNSQSIVSKYGYAFNGLIYDHYNKRKWKLQSQAIYNIKNDDIYILRGRPDDDTVNDNQRINYIGIQYNLPKGNIHKYYFYSRIHNLMNNLELKKLYLEVELNGFNLNIYKNDIIPLVIFINSSKSSITYINEKEYSYEEVIPTINKFLSGYYIVTGFEIIYKNTDRTLTDIKPNLYQKLILTKKEWYIN